MTSPVTRTKQAGSGPPPASVFDETFAWSSFAAARYAHPPVNTTAPLLTGATALPAPALIRLPTPADWISSAFQLPSVGATTVSPKRDVLSPTDAASNGPTTTIPDARPRKPPDGPISLTTFWLTRTSSTANTSSPARTVAPVDA